MICGYFQSFLVTFYFSNHTLNEWIPPFNSMHTFGFLGVSAVFLFVMFLRTRRLGHVRLYGVIRLTGLIHTEKKIHAQGNKIQPLVKSLKRCSLASGKKTINSLSSRFNFHATLLLCSFEVFISLTVARCRFSINVKLRFIQTIKPIVG